MAFTGAIGLGDLLAAGAADVGGLTLAGEAGAFGAGIDAASAAALAAGGAGLAGEAGAFGAGTDVAGLSAADLAAAGGLGLAGEAGAFGAAAPAAAIPTVAGAAPIAAAAPELALPGSALPTTAGLSATSATPSFASELATTPDAFAGWGGGSTTGLAGQSADLGFPAGGQGFSGIPPQGIGATPASGITGGGSDLAFAGPPAGTQTVSGIDPGALGAVATNTASPAAPPAGGASPPPAGTPPPSAPPGSMAAGGITDWIKANPLMATSLGLGAVGIGKNIISPQKIPQEKNLTALADQAKLLSQQNQTLEQSLLAPLTTGLLPPAQQAQVQQAVQDAETAIRSKYASMGMSGSTVEQDAINNARNQGVQLAGTIAEQMAQTGLSAGQNAASALNISGTIYESIMNAQISQDNALQAAIAAFAGQAAIGAGISATKKA